MNFTNELRYTKSQNLLNCLWKIKNATSVTHFDIVIGGGFVVGKTAKLLVKRGFCISIEL